MLRHFHTSRCVVIIGFSLLAGCQLIKVDAEPVATSSMAPLTAVACQQLQTSSLMAPADYYRLGQCFEKGLGVQPSLEKVTQNYTQAARWGVTEAEHALRQLDQPVPEADLLAVQRRTNAAITHERRVDQRRRQQEAERRWRQRRYWSCGCGGYGCRYD